MHSTRWLNSQTSIWHLNKSQTVLKDVTIYRKLSRKKLSFASTRKLSMCASHMLLYDEVFCCCCCGCCCRRTYMLKYYYKEKTKMRISANRLIKLLGASRRLFFGIRTLVLSVSRMCCVKHFITSFFLGIIFIHFYFKSKKCGRKFI